jgi:hypothetical protein
MNPFDRRWHDLVRAARAAKGPPLPEPDPNLGPFLLRRVATPIDQVAPGDDLWRWYGTRALAASMALLVICLALTWRTAHEAPMGRPAVENAVAETFWWL